MLESLFNKVAGLKIPTQVFSCKIYEIFKNTFLNRTPLVAAFVRSKKKSLDFIQQYISNMN